MSETLMISVSGMRGHVGTDLTPELVARHAAALGAWARSAGRPLVVLGRDARTSGAMFAQAAQRIVPVTDHTQPMTLPPEMLEGIESEEIEIVAAPPVRRPPTMLGIVAAQQPRSRPTVKPNSRRSK